MGLLDNIKKTNNAQWNVNRRPTIIDLTDTHIHFEKAAKTNDIFYQDIIGVEKDYYNIIIKTKVEKYKLTPRKIRGAKDLAEELYRELLEKMNDKK